MPWHPFQKISNTVTRPGDLRPADQAIGRSTTSPSAFVDQGRPYVGLDDQMLRTAMAAPVCGESHIVPLPA